MKVLSERFSRIMNLMARTYHKMEDEQKGVPRGQMLVLKFLCDNKDKQICQKDIENKFCIRASTASQIVSTLEEKSLLTRISDESDARKKILCPTEQALNIHNELVKKSDKFEEFILSGVTAQELATVGSMLDKVERNLKKIIGEETTC